MSAIDDSARSEVRAAELAECEAWSRLEYVKFAAEHGGDATNAEIAVAEKEHAVAADRLVALRESLTVGGKT